MAILAIDPGLTTGWASGSLFEEPTAPGRCGSVRFSDKMMDHGQLADLYEKWLVSMIRAQQCTRLVIERQFSSENASDAYLLGLQFVTHMVCFRHKIPRKEIPPSSWKKIATGSGKSDKKAVMRSVAAYGWRGFDEHACDAAAILIAARTSATKKER